MKEKIMTMAEFPPPESRNLERQLLADAIYNAPTVLAELIGLITPDMFSDDDRRTIWNTIVKMFNDGDEIDIVSVRQRTGQFFSREVLAQDVNSGSPISAVQHAELLRDAAARRRMYYSSLRMLDASTSANYSEEDILGIAEESCKEIRGEAIDTKEIRLDASINALAEELQEQQRVIAQGKAVKTPSGIYSVDRLTYGGFGDGNLIILAARPSVGKTALMLQMAKAAAEAGKAPEIFSLEMRATELTKRLLYSTGYLNPEKLSAANGIDWDVFEAAASRLSSLDISINDKSRNLTDICSRITINRQRGRCGIAFIDYLTLMRINARMDRRLELGYATRELKLLAMQCGIPIVLLAQLNRESAKDGRPPMLFDLKDSGDIEQDADIVMMLENVGEPIGDAPPDINLWLRKNRNGRRDVCIALRPNATYSDFRELGSSD